MEMKVLITFPYKKFTISLKKHLKYSTYNTYVMPYVWSLDLTAINLSVFLFLYNKYWVE